MKNKKGFTLIELLAVIVILGIIMTIATTSVLRNIKQSKIKARYIAAKDITAIASAYLETNNENCVEVSDLIEKGYLNDDVTNPADENAKNISDSSQMDNQYVCKSPDAKEQKENKLNGDVYIFNGYCYSINKKCSTVFDHNDIADNLESTDSSDSSGNNSSNSSSDSSKDVYITVDNLGEGIEYQKILVEQVGSYSESKVSLNNINLKNYEALVLDVTECNNARTGNRHITSVYDFYISEDGSKKVGATKDTFTGYESDAKYYDTNTVYSNRYCRKKEIKIDLKDVSNSLKYNLYIKVTHGQGDELKNEKYYSTWLYLKNLNLKLKNT